MGPGLTESTVCKFCQRLSTLECTKLMKVGVFLELDSLVRLIHSAFWYNQRPGYSTSLFPASKLVYNVVCGFASLPLAHEMFN